MIEYSRRLSDTFRDLGLEEFYAAVESGTKNCAIKSGCGKTIKYLPFKLSSKSRRADIDYAVETTISLVKHIAKTLQEYKALRKAQKEYKEKSPKLPVSYTLSTYLQVHRKICNGTIRVTYLPDQVEPFKVVISEMNIEDVVTVLNEYEKSKSLLEEYFKASIKKQQFYEQEKEIMNKLRVCA